MTCQLCDKVGHDVWNCWKRFNKNFKKKDASQALTALTLDIDLDEHDRTADIGASTHMMSHEGLLSNLTPYFGNDKVMVGNGSLLPITHTGTAQIGTGKNSLVIHNVVLVPDLEKKSPISWTACC